MSDAQGEDPRVLFFRNQDDYRKGEAMGRGGEMLQRWAVASLLRAERRFKRVKGYREIPGLIAVLEQKSIERKEVAA